MKHITDFSVIFTTLLVGIVFGVLWIYQIITMF